ncbi:hypothetical protein MMC11_003028 [Xylographa trunciseda]|nr:hypothetical protein [Xylographa trunciseda]
MAKDDMPSTPSDLPSSFTDASSSAMASSAATSTVFSSAMVSSTITPSSAASASSTASANQVDNYLSPGGIAAASVFGGAVLLSCFYLAYLAYLKLQNHRRLQKSFIDQENAPLADETSTTRPMSYMEFGKFPHEVLEVVVHQPGQPKSAKPISQIPTPSTVRFSPRPTAELNSSPGPSPSLAKPTVQAHLPDRQQRQRHSPPVPASRPSSSLPAPPPRRPLPYPTAPTALPVQQTPHSAPPPSSRSPPSRRPRPSRLHVPTFRPSKPPSPRRSLSPTSSTAHLMGHPATLGRRPGDVSPGLDPEYPYPMTPAQIGDGRPLSWLGRGGG